MIMKVAAIATLDLHVQPQSSQHQRPFMHLHRPQYMRQHQLQLHLFMWIVHKHLAQDVDHLHLSFHNHTQLRYKHILHLLNVLQAQHHQVTVHAYKALQAIHLQQRATVHRQRATAAQHHTLVQLSAQQVQLMLVTEHVYNPQAQQATAAHLAQVTGLDHLIQVQLILAVRLSVQQVQKMPVTEHVCKHQALQAMALAQHIPVATSQSTVTQRAATHRQQQHRLQLTYPFGSKFRHINLENPRITRGFFYVL